MNNSDPARARYCGHRYLEQNPTWDAEDSPWKAALVADILSASRIVPASIVDVGCGAGVVLAELRRRYPEAKLTGFDLAADASRFWARHAAQDIRFLVGDFLSENTEEHDVLLLLDVVEHVSDPLEFLVGLLRHARFFVLHIPLDLSAISVLREAPLLYVRRKVGHINYFTKGLALELLREAGYEVIDCRFTGASLIAPNRSWKTRMASLPRRMARLLGVEFGARLFGGETLLVLARASAVR